MARKLACWNLSYQQKSETVIVSQLLLKPLFVPAIDFSLQPIMPLSLCLHPVAISRTKAFQVLKLESSF